MIGVDLIQDFLEMALKRETIEYRLMEVSTIPLIDESIDIVWICLLLGGIIKENVLNKVVSEIDRVLIDGVLFALIENTIIANDGEYWRFHSVEFYQSLFNFANLKILKLSHSRRAHFYVSSKRICLSS